MTLIEESNYRLSLAEGYCEEARQAFQHAMWRTCVSSSQLCVENASKAVLGAVRPLALTHDASDLLLGLTEDLDLTPQEAQQVLALAQHARILGPREHVRTDDGDELTFVPPWHIYGQTHAERALERAKEALDFARQLTSALERFGKPT